MDLKKKKFIHLLSYIPIGQGRRLQVCAKCTGTQIHKHATIRLGGYRAQIVWNSLASLFGRSSHCEKPVASL